MAARKQKSKLFGKFLDVIGLVDSADGGSDGFDADNDHGRAYGRSGGRNGGAAEDEFYEEPRMSRVKSRPERPAQNTAAANDRFDADDGWGEGSSSGRPEYGARTQQRAQSGSRPSSGRYGGSAAQNARSAGRYEGNQPGDGGRYRAGSYQTEGYQTGSYRTNSSYGGYGASSRRAEADNTHYGSSAVIEQPQSGGQRHQTAIFKLHSVDECKGVILALIDKKSVLLNMEDLDSLQAQRTLDTMSGATFAIGAKLSRASDRTWLITPSTVEVDDGQNETGSAYGKRYI